MFPSCPPTLAAINVNDHIYLEKRIELVYEFKWKNTLQHNSIVHSDFFDDKFKIANTFKGNYQRLLSSKKTNPKNIF